MQSEILLDNIACKFCSKKVTKQEYYKHSVLCESILYKDKPHKIGQCFIMDYNKIKPPGYVVRYEREKPLFIYSSENNSNNIHCEFGAALLFDTDFKLYYIEGEIVSHLPLTKNNTGNKELDEYFENKAWFIIEHPELLTSAMIACQENEVIKQFMIKQYKTYVKGVIND